ncbi:hypothetical protein AeRB84_015179 [Aphanomyces euteiches]|nr:hypothetical protein AeRB84_015179 [Aphanomyces euteiches]
MLLTGSASTIIQADKEDVCLIALSNQDDIIDAIVNTSGDCQLSTCLSFYDTSFENEKGYVTGWSTALKDWTGIDGIKVHTSLLQSTQSDDLPDYSRDNFNLVNAAWEADSGANYLTASPSTDVLVTADTCRVDQRENLQCIDVGAPTSSPEFQLSRAKGLQLVEWEQLAMAKPPPLRLLPARRLLQHKVCINKVCIDFLSALSSCCFGRAIH